MTGASSYTILWSDSASAAGTVNLIADVTDTQYVHAGLTNLRTYTYRIAATSGGGRGPSSNPVQATPGPVSKVLGTTIRLSNLSTDEIKQGVEEAVLEEVPRLERFLPTLNTIITLEPLLGLLGTITGLMKLFKQYAVSATPEPALLAVGIQEALVTTSVGLAVAIVFYFFHNIIATRIDGVITQMEKSVVELLNFMRQEVRHGAEVQKTKPDIS